MPDIGVGMLGYAFMGKAHSNAFRKIAYMPTEEPLLPRLVAIAGRNEDAVAGAARRYGYERWTTDWHDLVTDDSVRARNHWQRVRDALRRARQATGGEQEPEGTPGEGA